MIMTKKKQMVLDWRIQWLLIGFRQEVIGLIRPSHTGEMRLTVQFVQ